jgi:8-oxo-dGTP pyrophosphatase MutT (NUDIX family)
MREITISEFNNINVYYSNKKIILPKDYSEELENYWNLLLQDGKKIFRGDSYTITKIETKEECVNIYVQLTDYAHFLYTTYKNTYTEHDCRVIYTSVLIETSDKKFILGEMNVGTAFPHKLGFIGGGVDKNDIKDNSLDLEHNIKKEILEELGIDVKNKSIVKELKPYFLKNGGENNFLSAIFKMDLLIDENQFRDMFYNYNERLISEGEEPEIKSLIFIQADRISIEDFINTDTREKDANVIPTLMAATSKKE